MRRSSASSARAPSLGALVREGLVVLGAGRGQLALERGDVGGALRLELRQAPVLRLALGHRLVEPCLDLVARLLRALGLGCQGGALLLRVVELPLEGEQAVVEVGLGALEGEHLLLRLDDLLVLLGQLLFEREDLLVLLV